MSEATGMKTENKEVPNSDRWKPRSVYTGASISDEPLASQDQAAQNDGRDALVGPKKNGFLEYVKRHYRGIAATTTIVIAMGGVGKAYDHYVLEPTRPIHQNYEETTFDPFATETHSNANNSVQMTLEEAKKEAPPTALDEENQTPILPIRFADGQIPTLDIKKTPDGIRPGNNLITMKGTDLQRGIFFSPYNGTLRIMAQKGEATATVFFISSKEANWEFDAQVSLVIDTSNATQLNSAFISVPVYEGEDIGVITGSIAKLNGLWNLSQNDSNPARKDTNFATSSDRKLILVK